MASTYVLNGMQAWLGIDSPTTAQTTLLTMAADDAENEIRRIRQQSPLEPIESTYWTLAVEMGVYLYEKRGVDGVSSFSENGISRVYERGSFPNSMLRRIVPKANLNWVGSTGANNTLIATANGITTLDEYGNSVDSDQNVLLAASGGISTVVSTETNSDTSTSTSTSTSTDQNVLLAVAGGIDSV